MMKKIFYLLGYSVLLMSACSAYALEYPDSRQITLKAAPTSSKTAKYSGPIFATPQYKISNEQYASLPACPATPACPDINGKMPNGSTPATIPPATCPDYCTVTRQVSMKDYTNSYTVAGVTISTTVTRIQGTTPAVCPPDYTSVAVYKVDKEIIYQTVTTPAPYPIKTIPTYDEYVSEGYTCDLIPQTTSIESCGQKLSVTLNQRTYIQPPYSIDSNTGVGVYTSEIKDASCYIYSVPNSCYGFVFPVSCNSAQPQTAKYYYPYSLYKCYPPPGLYYGDNMAPTAIVCTHYQPTWESHY